MFSPELLVALTDVLISLCATFIKDSASEDSRLTDEVSDDDDDEYSEPSGEIILELDADALPTDPIASTSRTSSSQPPSQPSKGM